MIHSTNPSTVPSTIPLCNPTATPSIYPTCSPTRTPSACPTQKPTTLFPTSLAPSSFPTKYRPTFKPSVASSSESFRDKVVNLITAQIELSALVIAIIIIFVTLFCVRVCCKSHGLNSEPVQASVEIQSSGNNSEGACYIMSNDVILIPSDASPEVLENFPGFRPTSPRTTFIQENSQRATLSMPTTTTPAMASPLPSSGANSVIRGTNYIGAVDSVITVHAIPITVPTPAVPISRETSENRLSLTLALIEIEEAESSRNAINSTPNTNTNTTLNNALTLNQQVNTTRTSMHLVPSPSRAESLLGRHSHGRRDRTSSRAPRTAPGSSANENVNTGATVNALSQTAVNAPSSTQFANASPSVAGEDVVVSDSSLASSMSITSPVHDAGLSGSSSGQVPWEQGETTIYRPSYISSAEASSAMLNHNDDDDEEYQEEVYDEADLEPIQSPIQMDPSFSQNDEGTYADWQQQLDEQVLDRELSVEDDGSALDIEDVHVFVPSFDLFTEEVGDGD